MKILGRKKAAQLLLALSFFHLLARLVSADVCPFGLRATFNNPAATGNDNFGCAVGVSGNLVLVGAYGDDPDGISEAGSAYVLDGTDGSLITTLHSPVLTAADFFGFAVAISGNLAAVGAYGDDPGNVSAAGTAYVFNAMTGVLLTTLNNPDPAAGDAFGYAIAISGNLVVVGAHLDNPNGVSNTGTAYVFDATTGALVATLNNPAPTADDWFGWSVAVFGGTAMVGALYGDTAKNDAGTAYLFNATSGALVTTLNNPLLTSGNDSFGYSVAVSENAALVGTPYASPNGISGTGTVYVFNVATGALTATWNNPAQPPPPEASDSFGWAVSISGDLVVVGARGYDPGGVASAGRSYVRPDVLLYYYTHGFQSPIEAGTG